MKIFTNFKIITLANILAMFIGLSDAALGADNSDTGKNEYDSYCATCHGQTGKGNGSLLPKLVNLVPDLTVLEKNNNGVFPFERVSMIIDGRQELKTHGSKEMPVWGRVFTLRSSIYNEFEAEVVARGRILALTEYVYRLQTEK
jgi:mono/diheme cytochrome c family protein